MIAVLLLILGLYVAGFILAVMFGLLFVDIGHAPARAYWNILAAALLWPVVFGHLLLTTDRE